MIPFQFICKKYLKFTNELNHYIDELTASNKDFFSGKKDDDQIAIILTSLSEHINQKRFCNNICEAPKFRFSDNAFIGLSGMVNGASLEADFFVDKTNFHCHIHSLEIQIAVESENLSYTYRFTPRGIHIHLLAYDSVEQFKFSLDVYEPEKCKIKITPNHEELKNPHFEVNKTFMESLVTLLKKEEDIAYSILFNKKMKIKQEYLDNIELIHDIRIENNRQETTSIDLNQYVKDHKKTIKKSFLK